MRRAAVVVAAAFVAGCGDGGSEPPPTPAAIVATSANPLASSVVGTTVNPGPVFEVQSTSGRAIGGVAVSVTVSSGGGTLTGAPTVSLPGPTPIGTWVLGEDAGPQSVTVTVAQLAPLEFTVHAQAAAPAELQIVSGHNQFGVAETVAAVPLRVRVVDAFDNPVAGASVGWIVAAGGGTIAGASSTTDAEGIATAPAWTLGADDGGDEAVVATLGTLSARFTALIGAVPASIVVEAPPPERAPVGEPIATVPTFSVRTADDVPISGFPVEIAVSAGGGTLAGAPTVTAPGAKPSASGPLARPSPSSGSASACPVWHRRRSSSRPSRDPLIRWRSHPGMDSRRWPARSCRRSHACGWLTGSAIRYRARQSTGA